MQTSLKTALCAVACAVGLGLHPAVYAQQANAAMPVMPVAQQNALVHKYCAVCHTDAHLNGGLTLEHFDAAHTDPGVAAMLISKVATGLTPKQVGAAQQQDPSMAELIAKKMDTGAMRAAGVPIPDLATENTLLSALAAEAGGANEWMIQTQASVLTASIVQEAPSPSKLGDTDLYRLTLTCHVGTNVDRHQGAMKLAWAPGGPVKDGKMFVSVDGKAPFEHMAEGGEKMFPGTFGTMGTGAVILNAANFPNTDKSAEIFSAMALPERTLTIGDLIPHESVTFPFATLPTTVRQQLSPCFTGSGISQY